MGDAVGPGAERPEEPGGRERRLANRNLGDEDLFGLEELAESYRRRPRQTGGEERTRAQRTLESAERTIIDWLKSPPPTAQAASPTLESAERTIIDWLRGPAI